jgi:thiaminase
VTEIICKYCSKEFRKESTLAAHLCEPKRRWQQENETGVQFGLRAYLQFYETTQGSARLKSYHDFVASPYYNAFVRFGRYMVAIRCINSTNFTTWLLKNNKKLDHWCKDSFYEEWLNEYVKKEAVQDALERGLKTMEEYAGGDSGLASFSHYFKYGNHNRICHHITTGRISPWVLYNCSSGIEFLENLDEVLLAIVLPWVDPDYWNRKFQDYVADAEWCKHVLKEAGL